MKIRWGMELAQVILKGMNMNVHVVVEEHDNIPGFRDHDVYSSGEKCKRKYILDISKGIRNWELVEK